MQTFSEVLGGKDLFFTSLIVAESGRLKPLRSRARSSAFIFSSLLITKPPCAKTEVHKTKVKKTKVLNRVMLVLIAIETPNV